MSKEWPLWEVFVRAKNGLAHKHVGSVHAADDRMAIEAARDTYTRRMEGVSLWVVPSAEIAASAIPAGRRSSVGVDVRATTSDGCAVMLWPKPSRVHSDHSNRGRSSTNSRSARSPNSRSGSRLL